MFYLDATEYGLFYLVTILDKGEAANLTHEDVSFFAGQVAVIKRLLREKRGVSPRGYRVRMAFRAGDES